MSNNAPIEVLVQVMVIGLASYRITIAFIFDEGPFMFFERIRSAVGVYDLGPDGQPELSSGRLFSCPACLGFWIVLIITLFVLNGVLMPVWVLFAAVGFQHFLSQRYLIS